MGSMFDNMHKFAKTYDVAGYAAAEGLTGMDKQKKEIAGEKAKQSAYEAGQAARAAEMESRRGVQVDTRAQNIAAASAAGATRVSNDSDLLGASSGGTKRRYASRVLLGE